MRKDELVAELRQLELRKAALESLRLRIAAVENALEALEYGQRLLLVHCFVRPRPGNLEALMEELGVEKTRIYELRNAALRSFGLALTGETGAEKNRKTIEHMCDIMGSETSAAGGR